ncbi:MAG: hypothetical protein ACFFFG_08265 [Candidatus Thorarchaeota archaeon]
MSDNSNARILNYLVYGVIAGVVSSIVNLILHLLTSVINLGKYNHIDFYSHRFLGTPMGNPDLVGFYFISAIFGVVNGVMLVIILFLLISKAGWERDLTRFLIVAIVFTAVFFPLVIMLIASMAEFDLILDGVIFLIINAITMCFAALMVYYLDGAFRSSS